MTRSRIGNARSSAARAEPAASFATRVGTVLSSPLGVMLVVPALVFVLGAVLVTTGDRALRGSNLASANERLRDSATLVSKFVGTRYQAADKILDSLEIRVREFQGAGGESVGTFAHALAARMNAVRGVSFISVSFPDGTFLGAYVDVDGVVRFQESRVRADHTDVRRFELRGDGKLALVSETTDDYDPRLRDFYRLAVARGERVWTDPYVFYPMNTTGVTRADPMYGPDGTTLVAVLTVDFDVQSLSSFLRLMDLPRSRAVIFDDHGNLLATPVDEAALRADLAITDRTIAFRDLRDPALDRFAHVVLGRGNGRVTRTTTVQFEVGGERYLAAIAPCSPDASVSWTIGYLVPESEFLGPLVAYEQKSISVAAVAILVALVLAWVFARHITKVRREAVEARRAANELGSYRLVEQLGEGGMGAVWRAEHRLLARPAAVKLIQPSFLSASDVEARTRFKREAEALATLRSRHTIEIYDYGVADDGTFFFVMELLDGIDLETLVARTGLLPAGRVASILAQICSSLAEAHERGMVHRDIKPANLFVCRIADEVDVVKVLDFGLVGTQGETESPLATVSSMAVSGSGKGKLTQFGKMLGTPGFMSPEQIHGLEVDGRADLYALGCVGFFLLTGTYLFDDPSAMKVLMQHLDRPVSDVLRLVPPEVPRPLLDVVLACLAKDRDDRPADARIVRDRLRALVFEGDQVWSVANAEQWWRSFDRPKAKPARPDSEFVSARTVVSEEVAG